MSTNSSRYGMTDEAFIKAFWGQHAMHIPLNLVIQYQGQTSDGRQIVALIGQSSCPPKEMHPLLFGSKKTHQLILGDAVIRPRIVLDTDAFRGYGLTSLGMMSIEEWLENPHGTLLDPGKGK